MKKVIIIILLISCAKFNKNTDVKNKDINEDLILAINNNDTNKAIQLINEGADINYTFNNSNILELALNKANLKIVEFLIEKEIEISEENIIKIYDLALEDFNYNIIDSIKEGHKLKEGLIDKNKYFLFLCYIGDFKNLKKYIEKNNIHPKEIKDKSNRSALNILCNCGGEKDIIKFLIEEYDFDINEKDAYGWTALMLASHNEYPKIVKLLLKKGANINERDSKGWTALALASCNEDTKVVKLLLEAGANINDKTIDDATPIILASQNGNIEIVKLLIEIGANINDKNNNGANSLMLASQDGHIDVVKLLLEAGANVNERDENGYTALILASCTGHIEVVKLLLEAGANVNDKTRNGATPLMVASGNSHIEVVKLLLEAGANINEKDEEGWTSLLIASQKGYIEIVKFLIEKGASTIDKNIYGKNSLMMALNEGNTEVVKLLIEKGSTINDKNNSGQTSLMIASQKGYIEIVRLLLEKGANINERDCKGWTALMMATCKGYIEIVELLLEKGANINNKTNKAATPFSEWSSLMVALKKDHIGIVKLLLKKNADINEKDSYGRSSVDLALDNENKEILILLFEKGFKFGENIEVNKIKKIVKLIICEENFVNILFYNNNILDLEILAFIYKELEEFEEDLRKILLDKIIEGISLSDLKFYDSFLFREKSLLIDCFINFIEKFELIKTEDIKRIKGKLIKDFIGYWNQRTIDRKGSEEKYIKKLSNIKNEIKIFISEMAFYINKLSENNEGAIDVQDLIEKMNSK